MTTFAAFVTAISGLTITGVTRTYTSTPESLGAADLPAQFIRLPESAAADAPIECLETGNTKSIDLVICLEPGGLEVASQNFADTVAMMDYIESALNTWNGTTAARGLLVEYSIVAGAESVGIPDYWAVVATITITG